MSVERSPLVLLFTANPALSELPAALQARGLRTVRVDSMEAARAMLEAQRARCVAVLDTYRPSPFSFAAVYRLLHEEPPVATLVLLTEGQGPPPLPREAALQDDYARLPARTNELVLRVQALVVRAGLPLPVAGFASPPPVETPRRQPGKLVVLFGPKGGVGRSTIATNLAVGLVQRYRKQIILVDADLWFGDVSVLLDLRGEKSIASLVDHSEYLDQDVLTDVLLTHPSGLKVLLAPPDPALVETIPPYLPARVVTAYRSYFDFVVVDTHPSLEEYMIQLLEVADQILLVTTPELSSIHNTAQVLKLAGTLGIAEKLVLVLNRSNSGIQMEHMEQTLGVKIDLTVVSAGPRVVEAANQGVPVLILDRAAKEQVTRDLVRLVAYVAGEPEPQWDSKPATPRRSLWRPRWVG